MISLYKVDRTLKSGVMEDEYHFESTAVKGKNNGKIDNNKGNLDSNGSLLRAYLCHRNNNSKKKKGNSVC